MSWTKRQFVVQAFEEIGYASYVYDLEPEQLESAVQRLDSMMATWNANGLRLSYPMPSSPELSDLDAETNVPDAANEAIYLNLALKIAPTVGKTPSPETIKSARAAYTDLLAVKLDLPLEMQMPSTMPVGAGNRRRRTSNPFFDTPVDPLAASRGDELEF